MMQEPTFRYIDRAEVCQLRGIGKTKQFEDEKAGYFPAGVRFSLRMIRWRSDIVAKWLEEESGRAEMASAEILARQSQASRKGVESRRQKRLEKASITELAGQA